jgi:hypothetical protein
MDDDFGFNDEDENLRLEDLQGLHVERVRAGTRPAKDASKLLSQPGVAVGADANEPLEHVGRRHFVRPDLAALMVGAVFIAAALVKPWGNIVSVPSPPGSPQISSQPLVIDRGSSEPTLPDYLDGLSRAWTGVDWRFLSETDTHSGWGISAASMAETTASTPLPIVHIPSVRWTPVSTATPPTIIDVGHGMDVFAIAITWPEDLRVTSVSFEYLGNGYDPPSATSGGFEPYTQLIPLSADAVAAPTEQPSSGSPHSGEFWVPPAIKSPVTVDRSLVSAWRLLPWSWPLGEFKVTITSQQQPVTLPIYLRPTQGAAAELSSAATP